MTVKASFSGVKVNNATARVMTNKKMTTPYANGEGLAALPYGNTPLVLASAGRANSRTLA